MYINDKCLYVLTWKHFHDFFFKGKLLNNMYLWGGNWCLFRTQKGKVENITHGEKEGWKRLGEFYFIYFYIILIFCKYH